MANDFYMGPALLWTKNADNFEDARKIIKSEFGLVEAHHKEGIPLEDGLVLPHPQAPNDLCIYRVRFKIRHDYGPFIDFKYDASVEQPGSLNQDLRALAIKRTSELVGVVKITDWLMNDVNLSYVRFSSE